MEWNECRLSCIRCRADCLEASQDITEHTQSAGHADDSINNLFTDVQRLGETCAFVAEQIKALPLIATNDIRPLQGINAQLAACQKALYKLDHALIALRQVKKSFFKQAARSGKNGPKSEIDDCREQIHVITTNLQLSLQILDLKATHLIPKFASEAMLDKTMQMHITIQEPGLDAILVECAGNCLSHAEVLCNQHPELALTMADRRQPPRPQNTINITQQQKAKAAVDTTGAVGMSQLPIAKPSNILSLDASDSPNLWGDVHCLTCSSNHQLIAWGVSDDDGCRIEIRLLGTGKLDRTLVAKFKQVHCLAFSEDGTELASGHDEGVILTWSLEGGRLSKMLTWKGPARAARARDLKYTPRGQHLISTHVDGEARIWRLDSGKKVHHRKQPVSHAVPSPDSRFLAAANRETIALVDFSKKFETTVRNVNCEVDYKGKHVAWNGNGQLAVDCGFGRFALYDSKLQRLGIIGPGRYAGVGISSTIVAVAFLPDDTLIALARDTDGTVYLCDVHNRRWFRLHDDHFAVSQLVQLSPSGEILITAQHGGRYCIWDVPKILEVTRVPATYTEFYAPGAAM